MTGERVSGARSTSHPAGEPATGARGASQPSHPVDLRLVAVTPDRSHLVLEDDRAQQFRVPLDERLVAALRSGAPRDRARIGQLEIALESQLSPREIQARIRAGRSVDEVSLAAGISPERVERYAGPVIAERQHVVEQAQKAPGRRASGGSAPALMDLVSTRLAEQKASPEATEWDAWRADEDDRWTVQLTYLAGARSRVATWAFDPRSRVLTASDEEARWLVDESAGDRLDDTPPTAVRRLTSIPGTQDTSRTQLPDEVYDREADERATAKSAPLEEQGHTDDSEPTPARQVATGRSGRRPAVPSFDDIMFGPRRRD